MEFEILVVDTRTWQPFGSVSAKQALCWVAGSAILCANQENLDVRDLTGTERFRLRTSMPAVGSHVLGTRAFLSYEQGAAYGILNLTSQKLTEVHAPLPMLLPNQPGLQPGTVP